MRNACKVEIKRAFQSTAMKIIIIIGALLAVWHTVDTYKSWQEYLQIREQYTSPLFSMRSLYTELMMMNGNEIQYVLFHNLLPLFAAFPFAVSYYADRKNGYQKNLYVRETRKEYFCGKITAVFLSGGTAVVMPAILDFIFLSTFMPAVKPDSCVMNGTLSPASNWQNLFYEQPFMYFIIYIMIYFVGGGILALFALAVSRWLKKSLLAFMSPFLLCIVMQLLLKDNRGFVPYTFLNMKQENRFQIWQMIVTLGVIAGVSIWGFLRKNKKEEVL